MLNYDPKSNLTHYPMPMARFGLNPYGEPMYRIVSTASRRNLSGGRWSNGEVGYRWVLTYKHIPDPWVLERWHSPWDFARCGKAQWDIAQTNESGYLTLGPYPDRGEYSHVHTFTCPIVDANLEKLIAWIEAGRERSWQDNLDACNQEYADEEKDKQGKMDAVVRNALPAYLDRPFVSGTGVKRGTKTAPMILTADQVKMPNGRPAPLGNNKFVADSRPVA